MTGKFETEKENLVANTTGDDVTNGETCGHAWVAEIELCFRCGLNAEAHAEENVKARRIIDQEMGRWGDG